MTTRAGERLRRAPSPMRKDILFDTFQFLPYGGCEQASGIGNAAGRQQTQRSGPLTLCGRHNKAPHYRREALFPDPATPRNRFYAAERSSWRGIRLEAWSMSILTI